MGLPYYIAYSKILFERNESWLRKTIPKNICKCAIEKYLPVQSDRGILQVRANVQLVIKNQNDGSIQQEMYEIPKLIAKLFAYDSERDRNNRHEHQVTDQRQYHAIKIKKKRKFFIADQHEDGMNRKKRP